MSVPMDRLVDALHQADAAGDKDGAQHLADLIRQQQPAPKQGPLKKVRDVVGGMVEHVGAAMPPALAAVPALEAVGYRPQTIQGRMVGGAINAAGQAVEGASEVVGEATRAGAAALGGRPEVSAGAGALAKTAVQAAATAISPETFGRGVGAKAAVGAAERAAAYVERHTSLAWADLPAWMQKTLTTIAEDATKLNPKNLDPAAIERQARLAKAKVPATQGQVERNLAKLTTEENLVKSDAGQPLRDVNAAADAALHTLLDETRAAVGAKTATRMQTGASAQGALRRQLREAKTAAGKQYDAANALGENEYTATAPLEQHLNDPIRKANVGWVLDRLKSYQLPDGSISLRHLEDVRQELTAAAKNPTKGGHYASEAAKVIDGMLDTAGSNLYKEARGSWKAMKDTYDKQARVKKLVTDKKWTTERAVALEDTVDSILRSPTEEIVKIRDTLKTGGKKADTKAASAQAWRDVQGGVLEHLREKAMGRRRIPGEKAAVQFSSEFLDAFNELEADGKIAAIFDKPVADRLRFIAKVVEDVRTKPTGRIHGADTIPRAFNMIEKMISKVPDIKGIGTAVDIAKKVGSIGAEGRAAKAAVTPALEQKAAEAAKSKSRARAIRAGSQAGVVLGPSLQQEYAQ